MRLKDQLGRYGERIAAQLLLDSGLRILDTNWRCPRGEIDIVAAAGSTLVVCEVKTRSGNEFGEPAEAVGRVKSARLRMLAVQWLAEHPGAWSDVRFDVISVLCGPGGPAKVRHLQGAF
jgi:putative endonuclease